MLRPHFLWKLYAGYVFVILIATIIFVVLTANRVQADTLAEIKESLRARVTLFREFAMPELAAPQPSSNFQDRVRALGESIQSRLTVIAADGTVLADSQENPALMDNHKSRPEIVEAGEQGFGTSIRFSNTVGKKMLNAAQSVRDDDRLLGYVRASLPLSMLDERLAHVRRVAVLGAGVACLVALILGYVVARRFAAPISAMTAVAESMSQGDYHQQLPVASTDEVGQLAQAFNRMARSLEDRVATITADHNKLLAILGGMVEGVVAVDREERILHINEVAARILQVAPLPLTGKKVWEATRVAEVCEVLAATLADGSETRGKFRIVTQPRDQVVEMQVSPLNNGAGKLVGAVVVLHDVTELERLETVRRDFVGNVSHELKTPITAIRGLVETMIEDRQMAPETRDRFLARIADQSARLSLLVTDLLALSRLEAADGENEWGTIDLCNAARASAQGLMPTAEGKGVIVALELPDNPVLVRGDAEALRQATTNLLDNAIKYTPAGGRVWLRVRIDGDRGVIEVQDSGVGIERQHQDRIFERFYRVDKARSRELGGTGLGLAIVKHVSIAHGGDVSVESSPGRGSTFRMRIPLS